MAIFRRNINRAAQRAAKSRSGLKSLKQGTFDFFFNKDFMLDEVKFHDKLRVEEQNKRKGFVVGGVRKTGFVLKSLVKYGPKGAIRARQKIKHIESNNHN